MKNTQDFFLLLSSSEYPILLALVLLLNVSGVVLYFNFFSRIGTFLKYIKSKNYFKPYLKKVVFIFYILIKTTIEDLEDIISSFGKTILWILGGPLLLFFGIVLLSFFKPIPLTFYFILINAYLNIGLPLSLELIIKILLVFFIIFNLKLISKMLPYFLILHWVLPTGTTQCAISFKEYVEIFNKDHLAIILKHYNIPLFMVQQYKIVTISNFVTVGIFTINTVFPLILTCLLITNKNGMTEIDVNINFLVLKVLNNKILVSENIVENRLNGITYNSTYSMDHQVLSFNNISPTSKFFKYQNIYSDIRHELLKPENQEMIKEYRNLLLLDTNVVDTNVVNNNVVNLNNTTNSSTKESTESPDSNSPRQTTKFLIILGSVCVVGGVAYGIKKLYFN